MNNQKFRKRLKQDYKITNNTPEEVSLLFSDTILKEAKNCKKFKGKYAYKILGHTIVLYRIRELIAILEEDLQYLLSLPKTTINGYKILKIHKYLAAIKGSFKHISDRYIESSVNKNTANTISQYRYKARFKNVSSNLNKIKGYGKLVKYGFYNRVSNPNGCVLDHRVSVKFGFDNNIDASIIGHLANCEFLTYNENAVKSKHCSISLDQLYKEIELF